MGEKTKWETVQKKTGDHREEGRTTEKIKAQKKTFESSYTSWGGEKHDGLAF